MDQEKICLVFFCEKKFKLCIDKYPIGVYSMKRKENTL